MKMKKTVAGILAAAMVVSTISATFAVNVSAETEAETLATTATATDVKVDLNSIARKNTTIDVTVPNYRMLASPTYAWTGTMTATTNKPVVKISGTKRSKLLGGKITVKGVDGNTLETVFSTDPDEETYNDSYFKGDDTIVIDFAALGGKLSTIKNVYNNARPGEATDTMYGEDVLDTPAITSITVQPYYAVEGAESWDKDEVNAYSNEIKGTAAQLTGVHAYTMKTVTEDGTTYSDITVLGKGSTDISAADAFSKDCENFKTEIDPYVKKTKEAFPVDPNKTAEEVWDEYAAKTGIGSDAVASEYTPANLNKLSDVKCASGRFVQAADYASKVVTEPVNTGGNGVPAGLDTEFAEADSLAALKILATNLTGVDGEMSVTLAVGAAKGTNSDADTVEFAVLVGYTDANGQAQNGVFKSTSVAISALPTNGPITLAGTAQGTQFNGFTTSSTADVTSESFVLTVTNATALKKALHTAATTDPANNLSTKVWGEVTNTTTQYTSGLALGTYKGSVAQVSDIDTTAHVPAGIDYTIPVEIITALNQGYGIKADVNAQLGFQPVMSSDGTNVTFYLAMAQRGSGIQSDVTLLFKSAELTVDNLANGELVLNGTNYNGANASGAAIRLKIDDAEALKEALVHKEGNVTLTPWNKVLDSSFTNLGVYVAGKPAVEPDPNDVIVELVKGGYAKPVKSSYSYKTAETKARTLSIPYYTKGDSAFNNKADFITTYNAVAECLKNLTTINDMDAQEPATDLTKYAPLSNFGPTANLYSKGKSKCTDKAEYKDPDAISPTTFGNATTDMEKENRVFGIYNEEKKQWEPHWVNITSWHDYYTPKYNGSDSTAVYTPGVLAEINDIIGQNKGAVISLHADPEGFESDGRNNDVKTWFELNGRCVLRVNGSSSSMYANLVTYDSASSTFSFNWDEISKDRYNDNTIQVRTLEILSSEKMEVDTITVSIPDQDAWKEATGAKPVDPEDDVVQSGGSDDNVIEIEDGDKTNSDNVEIEAPSDDDMDTPPADVNGEDTGTAETTIADIPADLTPSTDADATQKPVVEVTTAATVATENSTPKTGETGALAIIPVALAAVAGVLKKKLG